MCGKYSDNFIINIFFIKSHTAETGSKLTSFCTRGTLFPNLNVFSRDLTRFSQLV